MSIIANRLEPIELETKNKKVLIITYYWPPSGGAGVQRWLKFSKYLPEFGWDPVIFTPENPDFDLKDASLLDDVSEKVEVLKFPIWEPYKIFKLLSGKKKLNQGQILEGSKVSPMKKIAVWLRGNLFVPDPKRFWIKPSVDYISSILEANHIKTIITTGPPHSVHLIGKGLKMKNPDLTWVADFRDPWTEWTILKRMYISKPIWNVHRRMEQEVLKMADVTLATGTMAAEEFRNLGARKTAFITNGFDANDYPIKAPESHSELFRLTYVGMLSKERNPSQLWYALEDLCRREDFAQKFRLNVTGIISPLVKEEIESLPHLKNAVYFNDSVSHKEVFELYAQSDLLLLLQSNEKGSFSQLPGKLFEYLGARKCILALGFVGSDVDKILKETNAGELFTYTDRDGIQSFIDQAISQKQALSNIDVSRFERKALTEKLASLLDSL